MQSKYLATGIFCTGIAIVLTLSSFFKPSPSPLPPDQVSYNSNSKVVNKTGNLTLSSAFENDYYTQTNNHGFLYTEVEAAAYHGDEEIPKVPLNLSLVIDRSGSMAGEKMRNAINAAKYIVDQLGEGDFLSVVIYDSKVDLLIPTTNVINKHAIKDKLDAITDRGGTNLMGGEMMGFEQVKKNYRSGYINRVLLLSDGQANEGITDVHQIERIVRQQNTTYGVSVSTFGLGSDYNEDLMTAMAESATGNYYFISNAEQVASIFKKELNGISEVVAQNTKITITLPDNVNVDQVYGHRYDQVGRQLTVYLHDVFSKERKGVLVKYTVNNRINSTLHFVTSVSFHDVNREADLTINNKNQQEFTNNNSVYYESFNEWVSAQVALYESNERLENAMKEVDKGNYAKAKELVRENKAYIASKAPLVQKSVELQASQLNNANYDSNIEEVESMKDEDKKVMQKSYKSLNYEIRAKKR